MALPLQQSPANIGAIKLAKTRRESLRWLFIRFLHADMRYAGTDIALFNHALTEYPDATRAEVRRELHYLFLAKILVLTEKKERWRLQLTKEGVDIAEYTIHCPPGIWRPPP